jgi:uncharacterized membrane protein
MNPEIVPIHRKELIPEDGMLFVRSEGILKTMIKAPLLLAGLIFVVVVMPIQASFGSRTLDLVIYSDGSTHVSNQIDIDPLLPDFELDLLGSTIDNFVAISDSGFLLSEEIQDNKAIIDTFGSSSIKVDYDVHDLVSKEGRVWTFTANSLSDYTLLMPKNSVIVGMSVLPNNMEIVDDQTILSLKNGTAEINYIFGAPINPPDIQPPNPNEITLDYLTITIISIPIIAGAIITALIIKKKKLNSTISIQSNEIISQKSSKSESFDTESIFTLRPDMREDDKGIIKFISENGGQALESELRKKFLQPRTTMWRAVKRLERLGVIEIDKKDMQNLVKLKKIEEEKE